MIVKKFRWKSVSLDNQKLLAIFVWFQMLFEVLTLFWNGWTKQWRFSDKMFGSFDNVTECWTLLNIGGKETQGCFE